MKRLVYYLKRIVSGGAAAFIASVIKPGIAVANRLSFTAPTAVPAVAIDISRQSALVDQKPGFAVSLQGATGNPAKPAPTPAFAVDITRQTLAAQSVAKNLSCAITQVVYNLTRRVGANASANVTGTWATLTSAEGRQDNADATSTGAAMAASRKLRLDYVNHVSKTELTISSVKLFVYVQSAGNTGGLLGSVTFTYNIGAGEVTPSGWNARTDTFDFTTTPDTIDITAPIGGDWAKIDALQTFVLHTYADLSALFTVSVDAIELEVIASRTEDPNP